jgi:hypothetical protein
MKFIKFIILPVILLGAIGLSVYYFGTNVASEKVMDSVSTELEKSGEIEEVKQSIQNDPDLKSFINDDKSVDESKLPFKTKEEATRVVIKKVGISELNNIKTKVQNGTMSKQEALNEVQGKLTKEEILALKVIAYKELNKK